MSPVQKSYLTCPFCRAGLMTVYHCGGGGGDRLVYLAQVTEWKPKTPCSPMPSEEMLSSGPTQPPRVPAATSILVSLIPLLANGFIGWFKVCFSISSSFPCLAERLIQVSYLLYCKEEKYKPANSFVHWKLIFCVIENAATNGSSSSLFYRQHWWKETSFWFWIFILKERDPD